METESRSVHFGQFSHLWDKEPSTARNEGCCRFIYQPELHFIIRICSKHVRNMWPVFAAKSWDLPGLVNIQKAIEHGPVEIVSFPIKNGDFP